MFRVILVTEKGDIELRDKPRPEESLALRDVVVISVGGEDYEVSKDDLNAAIKPFLYSNERMELQ